MTALLVRVAADQSGGGGNWNGPVDGRTGAFAYVAIPEGTPVHPGLEKPYRDLLPALAPFGTGLPDHLAGRHMHLDPDFDRLTYGDRGERGKQLRAKLRPDDTIVFYAGLADARNRRSLVYALIGLFVVDRLSFAVDLPPPLRDCNAHGRRILPEGADDVIVHGCPGVSGRLARCIPIGEWRDRAYRVRHDVLEAWGGLSVRDGYLQRSARLPEFPAPDRFHAWLADQRPVLIARNNP
ncbi:MAG: hypothetical protein KGJ41_17475 [Rhodospirillales bacterium]|nr:hypothetical protein [Rhodospirillales bacterium]MDE2575822.1 hypothetical protein [Rhodospirillales bacterium]